MNIPSKTFMPFFAYGLFKPGQLCFPRIKELVVKTIEGTVDGVLKERDGVPLLEKSDYSKIKGYIFYFLNGKEEEAYQRIIEIEPDEIYQWDEIIVNDKIVSNVLLGKRVLRGSSYLDHFEDWDGRSDPLFKQGLEEVEAILRNNSSFSWDYKSLFRLQMAYMLLWSAIERYAGLKYHLGKRVNEKVYQIAKEKCFADSLRKNVKGIREVFSVTDLTKYMLDPNDPEKSIRYYYQIRSNTVHRGKVVSRDYDTIKCSLKELVEIFKDILSEAFK